MRISSNDHFYHKWESRAMITSTFLSCMQPSNEKNEVNASFVWWSWCVDASNPKTIRYARLWNLQAKNHCSYYYYQLYSIPKWTYNQRKDNTYISTTKEKICEFAKNYIRQRKWTAKSRERTAVLNNLIKPGMFPWQRMVLRQYPCAEYSLVLW